MNINDVVMWINNQRLFCVIFPECRITTYFNWYLRFLFCCILRNQSQNTLASCVYVCFCLTIVLRTLLELLTVYLGNFYVPWTLIGSQNFLTCP